MVTLPEKDHEDVLPATAGISVGILQPSEPGTGPFLGTDFDPVPFDLPNFGSLHDIDQALVPDPMMWEHSGLWYCLPLSRQLT